MSATHIRVARARTSDVRTPEGPGARRVTAGLSNRILQAALRGGPIDHPLEREADRAADAVMSGGGLPALAPAAAGQTPLQTKPTPAGSTIAGAGTAVVSLAGDGRPLAPEARAFFERRFGRNSSDVRIHTGAAATGGADAIQARAFTAGRHTPSRAGSMRSTRQQDAG